MEFIEDKRPRNTVKSHQGYVNEFLTYSEQHGLDPKTPTAVASFMKYCVTDRKRKLGRTTVCQTIPAAINHLFLYSMEKPPTDSTLVREMRKTIMKSTPTPTVGRRPITMAILQKLVGNTDKRVESIRNTFMVILMTFAMLRESELVNLKKDDVWEEDVEDQKVLHVFIERSKTDQAGDGQTISLTRTGTDVCPVEWFHRFLVVRTTEARFLFHPLGVTDVSQPLSSTTPNFVVKRLLLAVGVDATEYGSHSCRKGGCTMAVDSGADLRIVARHGRWKSSAIMAYVKDSVQTKLTVTKAISKGK